jgi:predicted AlkP superfamily pyrophosphatase or phosphodiesterase
LKGSDTTLIITADHGQIDTPRSKVIFANDHPKLYETLTLPLCGEPRVAYCYVHPSKSKQFENYVKDKLDYCCELYRSEDLIKRGMFGLYKPNDKLFDRVGDYILIMKDNYFIKDSLLGESLNFFKGNHGGLSEDEMLVPLVLVNKY